MKQRASKYHENDHPASLKEIMTTPPISTDDFEQIQRQRMNARRKNEAANDARALRQADSIY
jgi:hypothetical protein